MTNALAKLQNISNFGPSGTVAHSLSITETFATASSITATSLSNYDILFIPYVNDGAQTALTTAEIQAIYQQIWVLIIAASFSNSQLLPANIFKGNFGGGVFT